jgi:TolB-like protein
VLLELCGVINTFDNSWKGRRDGVRITGQLIDTATGAHIWADRFDGSF